MEPPHGLAAFAGHAKDIAESAAARLINHPKSKTPASAKRTGVWRTTMKNEKQQSYQRQADKHAHLRSSWLAAA